MKHEPYNFDSFKKLVAHAYNLGWYTGTKTIFNLKCEGAFEGWSGRATEDWETKFTLSSDEIVFDGENGQTLPAINVTGSTIKEVCDKALLFLKI